jgi:hypothetical protein
MVFWAVLLILRGASESNLRFRVRLAACGFLESFL